MLQILTKAGALNVPEWYEAGKVSAESSGIPTCKQPACISSKQHSASRQRHLAACTAAAASACNSSRIRDGSTVVDYARSWQQ